MKKLTPLFVAMLFLQNGFGQTVDAEGTLMATVRALYTGRTLWEGQREKQLRKSGDATAVAITKIIGDDAIQDEQIRRLIDIIDASFEDLSSVEIPGDREPRTTDTYRYPVWQEREAS